MTAPVRIDDARLARARALARLLDGAVRVPGTGVRVGLDPLLGLVPGFGDVAGAALSGYVVLLAARLGAPRATLVRMVANVAIDTAVGSVPVLGDLFDVAWRSNTRNVALLEDALGRTRDAGAGADDRRGRGVAVWLVALALLLLAALGVIATVLVVRALVHALR